MEEIKAYVAREKARLAELISKLDRKPSLVIVQVGHVPASDRYVANKLKDAVEVGIEAKVVALPDTVTEDDLIFDTIKELNEDPTVDGFIVQLPLPKHINEKKVIDAILPAKDADGFSPISPVFPATPTGIIDYLVAQDFDFTNKNAVVLGRSNIVGAPLSKMLLAKNCNVTTLHSKTSEENKRLYLKNADLIVSAVGKRNMITSEYELKSSCVVIDVGINFNDEGKLCGDIEQTLNVAFKSPVPGGTGLTTRLALMTNLLKLCNIDF